MLTFGMTSRSGRLHATTRLFYIQGRLCHLAFLSGILALGVSSLLVPALVIQVHSRQSRDTLRDKCQSMPEMCRSITDKCRSITDKCRSITDKVPEHKRQAPEHKRQSAGA